jgi:hypothetical protein
MSRDLIGIFLWEVQLPIRVTRTGLSTGRLAHGMAIVSGRQAEDVCGRVRELIGRQQWAYGGEKNRGW